MVLLTPLPQGCDLGSIDLVRLEETKDLLHPWASRRPVLLHSGKDAVARRMDDGPLLRG
jgi:hypothetical protein